MNLLIMNASFTPEKANIINWILVGIFLLLGIMLIWNMFIQRKINYYENKTRVKRKSEATK